MQSDPPLQVGRRKDSRLRCTVPARIITLTGHHNVALRDVSQSGAKLDAPEGLRKGDDGVLEWLGFEAFGSVVWTHNGLAGFAFDQALPQRVIVSTREQFDNREFKTHEEVAREQATDWYLGYKNRPR